MTTKKISLNELKLMIRQIIKENTEIDATIPIRKQQQAFNQRTGQYINLKDLNEKYADFIIQNMKKDGVNLIKKYTNGGILYLVFDVQGNIYNNTNINQIISNADKFWNNEAKKLVN